MDHLGEVDKVNPKGQIGWMVPSECQPCKCDVNRPLPGSRALGGNAKAVHGRLQGDAASSSAQSFRLPLATATSRSTYQVRKGTGTRIENPAVLKPLWLSSLRQWISASRANSARLPGLLRCGWAVIPTGLRADVRRRGPCLWVAPDEAGARRGCHVSVPSTGHLPGVPCPGE